MYKWYDVVSCKSLYPEKTQISLLKELKPLFAESEWLCPKITDDPTEQIYLQYDPKNYPFGISFNMVINFCDVVAKRKGIIDPNCKSNERDDRTAAYDYLNKIMWNHKIVRQFFNPDTYRKDSKMDYTADFRR